MGKINDLTGKRFGRLTVISFSHLRKSQSMWLCKCDCGTEKLVQGSYMTSQGVQSCGCLTRELSSERGKIIGKKNISKYVESKRKPKGESSRNHLFYLYKYKANKRKIEFALSIDDFAVITKQSCHYCGIEPNQIQNQKGKSTAYIFNGIDRIDNSKGYILDNCVPCCKQCNTAKMASTKEEFLIWINRVYHYQNRDDYLDVLGQIPPYEYEKMIMGNWVSPDNSIFDLGLEI